MKVKFREFVRQTAARLSAFLRFSASSIVCETIDVALFTVFSTWVFTTGAMRMMESTICARLVSGSVNFTVNRNLVFRAKGKTALRAVGFFALYLFNMFASGGIVTALAHWGLPAIVSKLLADFALFWLNYAIQHLLIFRKKQTEV
jgi:putative flippase GtrA